MTLGNMRELGGGGLKRVVSLVPARNDGHFRALSSITTTNKTGAIGELVV
jgi:hypothetical protein